MGCPHGTLALAKLFLNRNANPSISFLLEFLRSDTTSQKKAPPSIRISVGTYRVRGKGGGLLLPNQVNIPWAGRGLVKANPGNDLWCLLPLPSRMLSNMFVFRIKSWVLISVRGGKASVSRSSVPGGAKNITR